MTKSKVVPGKDFPGNLFPGTHVPGKHVPGTGFVKHFRHLLLAHAFDNGSELDQLSMKVISMNNSDTVGQPSVIINFLRSPTTL